ncbi:MAG: flagellar type III secretion system pore protein FliP [Lachnospiraceae bacterium]|nr:flagellar type III secretion system pore protein FliP [Lachnospiraceae bacterium]
MMCILTFICHATIYTDASDATVNTTSNEDTNPDEAYLEGDLGGLTFQFSGDGTGSLSATLQILLILTVISLAPSILIMLTSFTRIIIVLHFLRTALGTQTTPPNQVMIGLALFLTFFIMSPVFNAVNNDALKPLSNGDITIEEAFEKGLHPIREFMFDQMEGSEKDLSLFLEIAGVDTIETRDDVPTSALIPAFILSELRIAFIIGFMLYIPFLVIDMVVSSTLMSMGMMMLPPTTISMPFKILLFILADGWDLVIGNVVKTFFN